MEIYLSNEIAVGKGLQGLREGTLKVNNLDKNRVSEKCHSRENEGVFYTRKRPFLNTEKDFETKTGCTFRPKCAIYAAKRGFFDEKSSIASIKNWLRTKKSSVRFFHAEFALSPQKRLTHKESARYTKSEI